MPRRIAKVAATGSLVGGLVLLSPALGLWSPSASAQPPFTSGNIPICHRTASITNPYVSNAPNINAIESSGHLSHTGPIFPDVGPDGFWGDIIPPILPFLPDGMNWNPRGIAIWEAGCDVDVTEPMPPPEETTTTTTAPGETTTTAPGETTTTAPGETTTTAPGETTTTAPGETTTTVAGETTTTVAGETTTTVAGETTTTVAGETTTTTTPSGGTSPPPPTAPPSPPPESQTPPTVSPEPDPPFPTDPPGGSETLPPIEAEVIDPGGVVVDIGTLDPTESAELESDLDTGITNDGDTDDGVPGATGAATGKPFGAEEIAGTVLVAGGAGGLALLLRRRQRR